MEMSALGCQADEFGVYTVGSRDSVRNAEERRQIAKRFFETVFSPLLIRFVQWFWFSPGLLVR